MTTGYSGKPLHAKLGIKPGAIVTTLSAPADYATLLGDPPASVRFTARLKAPAEFVHVFATSITDLEQRLARIVDALARDGVIWVSWPKQASKVATDITEDRIRDVAFPFGLVDVKVCAVSEVWSGLKLVIRKQLR